MTPSLRVIAPLILVLFAGIAGVVGMANEYLLTRQQMLNNEIDSLQAISSLLQGSSEQFLRHGHLQGIQSQLASLTIDPAITSASIASQGDRILFSSAPDLIDKSLIEISPLITAELLHKVHKSQARVVVRNADDSLLFMLSPVLIPSDKAGLRDYQVGVMAIETDLGFMLEEGIYRIKDIAIKYFASLFILALFLALMYHLFVTRRFDALLHTTRRIAAGDLAARSQLSGNDEIADLGHSIDYMAEVLAEDQETIRNNKEVLELSQAAADIGSWEWRIDRDEIYWSDHVYEMLDLDVMEETRRLENIMEFIHPEDQELLNRCLEQAIAGKQPYHVKHRVVLRDGSIKWFQEEGEVIYNETDEPVRIIGICRDVTEQHEMEQRQKLLQKQLLQSQKMESIGQLTGGVAHDFNNILAVILGYAQLARERFAGNEDSGVLNDYLNQVIDSGERAAGLVRQMLAYSRGEGGDAQLCRPGEIIKESLLMLQATIPRSIKIQQLPSDCEEQIRIDSVQLHQLLMNLVINARDAMPDQVGEINIGFRLHDCQPCTCSSCYQNLAGGYCEIFVQDNGSGIAPENLDRLFEPFFTTKGRGKGTGMGLAVVHGIMHANGGHLLVESEPGQGTTIHLLFPVQEASDSEQDAVAAIQQQSASQQASGHILVVDDEQAIVNMIRESLEMSGYQVDTAIHAREALEKFSAAASDYNLVITDQTMPEMTGMNLAREILQRQPELPVILCTGYSDTVDAQVARDAGIAAFLQKPINLSALESEVARLLRTHPG